MSFYSMKIGCNGGRVDFFLFTRAESEETARENMMCEYLSGIDDVFHCSYTSNYFDRSDIGRIEDMKMQIKTNKVTEMFGTRNTFALVALDG